MAMFGFPHWQLKSTSTESGVVAPDERLPFAQTAVMGVQHAVAMFGATVFNGQGINPNISIARGGIIACGLVYTVIGLVVMKIGTRWIERLMPPVVTGAVVMAIGLNLAPIAVKNVSASAFDSWMA